MIRAPSRDQLIDGVLALGRDLHLDLDERELCARWIKVLAELLPGRALVLRVDRAGEGRLCETSRGVVLEPWALTGPIALKRSSLRKTRLDLERVDRERVLIVESPPPVVQGAARGFSIPLVASGALLGALDVAYAGESSDALADGDEKLLIPLANQLSVALRNCRLHRETSFLRDYLGQLVEHAGALILGIDPAWRITVYNRAIAQLTGYAADEILGTDLRDWIPGHSRNRLMRVVLEVLAGREAPPVEVAHTSREGRPLNTVWTVTAVGRGQGTEAIVAVGQDVTRLHSLQKQVIQAEKLATLGQLAAGVVHELNNPLTSVIVYAEYLLRKLEKAPGGVLSAAAGDAEKLRRILEGAERIQNLSRSLVQYAKPSNERLDVVSLNDVVRQGLLFTEHEVRTHGVVLSCRLADDLPPLYGIRSQLQQVIINLVTNAVHALPPHGGQVRVSTFVAPGGELGLTVQDTGRGIPQGDLPRLFEPFFTTKTDGRGTGLGLSIVQGIVERHHGTVRVDSTPGRGTTFTVLLPTGHAASEIAG